MSDSKYIHLSHNVSNIVYHFVFPTKYRRIVIDEKVDKILKEICIGIELRFEYIKFLEIGADKDHVHFLIQSLPNYSPSSIVNKIKSITARKIFEECPQVKKNLWGGNFWSSGYFVSTVGKYTTENTIKEYVKRQGKESEYVQLKMRLSSE